jgi:hypothetical protein
MAAIRGSVSGDRVTAEFAAALASVRRPSGPVAQPLEAVEDEVEPNQNSIAGSYPVSGHNRRTRGRATHCGRSSDRQADRYDSDEEFLATLDERSGSSDANA